MRLLRPIIIIAATIAVVFAAHYAFKRSAPQQQQRGGGATTVVTETVQAKAFADRTEAIGTVSANESITVTPAATERVAKVLFADGAHVEQGDVLIELEHAEESASLDEARVNLQEQTRLFDRVKMMSEQDLVSQEEFDQARGALETAQARYLSAESRLQDRIITAPFGGVLGIRQVSPGTLVSPGDVITTLDDLSVVKVDFTVPEALLSQIAVDQPIRARSTAWPDVVFAGVVTSVDSRVSTATRAVKVQATVPNPDRKLRGGMLLNVELTCCPRESVAVPEKALLVYADKQYVYVVRDDNTAEQRALTLGTRDVGWVEVVEGLQPGETVVVDGLLNLRDGAPVRVADSGDDSLEQTGTSSPETE